MRPTSTTFLLTTLASFVFTSAAPLVARNECNHAGQTIHLTTMKDGATAPPAFKLGKMLGTGESQNGCAYLVDSWTGSEDHGKWLHKPVVAKIPKGNNNPMLKYETERKGLIKIGELVTAGAVGPKETDDHWLVMTFHPGVNFKKTTAFLSSLDKPHEECRKAFLHEDEHTGKFVVGSLFQPAATVLRHHIEQHGILHREITPGNSIWSPAGDTAVFIDWENWMEKPKDTKADQVDTLVYGAALGFYGSSDVADQCCRPKGQRAKFCSGL